MGSARTMIGVPCAQARVVGWKRREWMQGLTLFTAGQWIARRGEARAAVVVGDEDERREILLKAFHTAAPQSKAPVLLRLAFHDAGTYDAASNTGGANGSIRFELDRPENGGLKRGLRCIDEVKNALKGTKEESASYADLIAVGGAYAVEVCGGPRIEVPVGRVDADVPDPEGRMPLEDYSAGRLKEVFTRGGYTVQEFVALSGAHTVGGKGFGAPLEFSSVYYSELLRRPWEDPSDKMNQMIGLASDHAMATDEESLVWIRKYAEDQDLFFRDFSNAYRKMSLSGARFV